MGPVLLVEEAVGSMCLHDTPVWVLAREDLRYEYEETHYIYYHNSGMVCSLSSASARTPLADSAPAQLFGGQAERVGRRQVRAHTVVPDNRDVPIEAAVPQ